MIAFESFLRAGALALAMVFPASAAVSLTPLNEEKHINDSLISAGIGELIRRNCPTISARYFVVFRKAMELEKYATDMGYSKAEIDAFLDSKVEQKRVRMAAEKYLAENGVVKGDKATYCAVGRAEIAKGTLTGKLLRAR